MHVKVTIEFNPERGIWTGYCRKSGKLIKCGESKNPTRLVGKLLR